MLPLKVILLTVAIVARAHGDFVLFSHSTDAIASTKHNVVGSYDGTLSQYSKAIDTPYTSIRKQDNRVSNNVYQGAQVYQANALPAVYEHRESIPAIYEQHQYQHQQQQQHYVATPTAAPFAATPSLTKTLTYSAPAGAQTVSYAAPALTKAVSYGAPTASSVYSHQAPVAYSHPVAKTVSYETQAPVYHQEHHEVPVTTYSHGPSASTYTHNAPGVAAYGSSQTVHFSPAEMVSHMRFDGFGTHYGF